MFDTKIAIVVRDDLATWQKLNVTAFLTSGIVGASPDIIGEAYRDALVAQVKRLKIGSARRFSTTTRKSLVAQLRTILTPEYVTRARKIATRMTKSAASVSVAADLLEETACTRRSG